MLRALFTGLAITGSLISSSSYANHEHHYHNKQEKTFVLDVVFSATSPLTQFIVDIGGELVSGPSLFPAGSNFMFTALVYPGKTFSKNGPFALPASLASPNKIIGRYYCSGAFVTETPVFSPIGNEEIALADAAFSLDNCFPLESAKSIQSFFISYIGRTISTNNPGAGQLARVEAGTLLGGTGINAGLHGTFISKTYVDQFGNFLIRHKFSEPIALPDCR